MQIVGYRTRATAGPATLQLADQRRVSVRPLRPGEDLEYVLGSRHCAGSVDDGVHEACERESTPYCERHTTRWPCARCDGTCTMPIEACHEEHAVYLAGFAPSTVKVGVTRHWRLETRLREQGADRAAHLRTVKNGRVARQLESDLASRFPDRARVTSKIGSLHESFDEAVWTEILDEFDPRQTFDFEYGLEVASRPVAETIASGTIEGTKGRILVVNRSGTKYATDLRDLVGYEVRRGRASRELQSSFGRFD